MTRYAYILKQYPVFHAIYSVTSMYSKEGECVRNITNGESWFLQFRYFSERFRDSHVLDSNYLFDAISRESLTAQLLMRCHVQPKRRNSNLILLRSTEVT